MKCILLMAGLLWTFGLVGCQQEDENPGARGVMQQEEDVREGGPEESGPAARETPAEAAVPEYEERERGEMADGDQ